MNAKSILAIVARAAVASLAGALVHHGWLDASKTQAFIGIAMLAAAGAWDLWSKYGYDIAVGSLEILRAKVQNAADVAMRKPNSAGVSLAKLNAHVVATAPVTEPVAPLATVGVALLLAASLWGGDAHAQTRATVAAPSRPALCDPLKLIPGCQGATSALAQSELDLVDKIQKLSLADFKYALALATATNNVVSMPCWQVWVDLITAQQEGVKNADGTPMAEPDPHIITSIERISELLANLRPDSKLSIACTPLASASGKDAATLMGGILSGGALGLFKLPIPIP